MFPNPQAALPLPPKPNLDQYRKLAKGLVKACRSGVDAIDAWAAQWTRRLAARLDGGERREAEYHTGSVAEFARRQMGAAGCALSNAQFVVARSHGFERWPRFEKHLEWLARATSPVARFELAADAIVNGDAETLRRLLREHPQLVRARSTREHRATLLHYVSANGVEGYRQKSPATSAAIARVLLDAGAEVDATADVYGGGWTTLGLVATSAPPHIAGVQLPVIDVLLQHGARLDHGSDRQALVRAALANGQPVAAAYLVTRGAPIDVVGAAGLGRVDALQQFFDNGGRPRANVARTQTADGFALACAYGRTAAVEFLLSHGIDVDAELTGHGAGHTALHVAAYHGHDDLVELLLRHGARVDVSDKTWGTTPLSWALTGWVREEGSGEGYYAVVKRLVAAGATVKPELLESEEVRADANMRAALTRT